MSQSINKHQSKLPFSRLTTSPTHVPTHVSTHVPTQQVQCYFLVAHPVLYNFSLNFGPQVFYACPPPNVFTFQTPVASYQIQQPLPPTQNFSINLNSYINRIIQKTNSLLHIIYLFNEIDAPFDQKTLSYINIMLQYNYNIYIINSPIEHEKTINLLMTYQSNVQRMLVETANKINISNKYMLNLTKSFMEEYNFKLLEILNKDSESSENYIDKFKTLDNLNKLYKKLIINIENIENIHTDFFSENEFFKCNNEKNEIIKNIKYFIYQVTGLYFNNYCNFNKITVQYVSAYHQIKMGLEKLKEFLDDNQIIPFIKCKEYIDKKIFDLKNDFKKKLQEKNKNSANHTSPLVNGIFSSPSIELTPGSSTPEEILLEEISENVFHHVFDDEDFKK